MMAAEKVQYDEMFTRADTDRDGFVNGAEIKDIFLQSGLPQLVLAHIWSVLVFFFKFAASDLVLVHTKFKLLFGFTIFICNSL